jgi:hypothetical protein
MSIRRDIASEIAAGLQRQNDYSTMDRIDDALKFLEALRIMRASYKKSMAEIEAYRCEHLRNMTVEQSSE